MNARAFTAASSSEAGQTGGTALRLMTDADADRWDNFVRNTPEGTFFHLSGWRRLIEQQLNHTAYYIYIEQNGLIKGVLPLVHLRSRLFGNSLISTPFLVYGGPVAEDAELRQRLANEAVEIARRLGVDHLELKNRNPIGGEDWHTQENYVSFRKAISSNSDKNLSAIPRKQRAMIRKGIEAGLTAEMDDDVLRLDEALQLCKRNLGTPFFSRKWLAAIRDTFLDDVEVLVVTHRSRTICGVMSFRFRNEILPYYGGGGDLARLLKGNDFMYWAVMERASTQGVTIFDYGRSQVGSGAYRFKKHWGFEPQPLAYQFHLINGRRFPELNPANPRYRMLISAWKRLPVPVARIVGPRIARGLG